MENLLEQLDEYLEKGLITKKKHPTEELYIFNYTPTVQYEKLWDEVTTICRGLILDEEGRVVARPFPKFFNYEELPSDKIPAEKFRVFEKMDGSLGILYWVREVPYIATRGSFVSEQAIHATTLLHTEYVDLIPTLDKSCTYLFEIIYPENRIVVDYKGTDDIILLAIINNKTGEEKFEHAGFYSATEYKPKSFSELKNQNVENREGYVLRFESGLRIKIKFEDYVRLHIVLTNVTSRTIWEYLSENRPLGELLEKVPDEFYNWVNETALELYRKYKQVYFEIEKDFVPLETRKETAELFKKSKYKKMLFNKLDGKDYTKLIFQYIKPAHSKPFYNERSNIN